MSDVAIITVDETTAPFVGQWNRLVSTTNWEKGRIILEWRQALVAAGGPAAEYSDEAWSLRVGNVTGQHVGRLRRVYERFDALRAELTALYWSHFQAALDWDDAEMWLEGAEQSGWSVAEMRRRRWETLGAVEADRPRDHETPSEPLDEDANSIDAEGASRSASPANRRRGTRAAQAMPTKRLETPAIPRTIARKTELRTMTGPRTPTVMHRGLLRIWPKCPTTWARPMRR